MGSVTECSKPVREILSFLTEDDLREYTAAVMEKAREIKDKRGVAAIKSAQEEIENSAHNELIAAYFENAQASIQNYKLLERNTEMLKKSKNLRNILVRDSANNANRSLNVESAQRAEQNHLMNAFLKDLSTDDIAYLVKKDNDLTIAKAGMGEGTNNPIAAKISKALMEYRDERTFRSVESHAIPLRYVNKDRFLRMSHDPAKLVSGLRDKTKAMLKGKKIDPKEAKNQWINYIFPRLDLEKTFALTSADKGGVIDEAEARRKLESIYDRIVTGSDDVLGSAIKYKDLNMIQRKRLQFFEWKDAQSWVEYNNQYGSGSLYNALLADIRSSGNRIGLYRTMGSKPTTMYQKLATLQEEVAPKSALWKRNTGLMFNEVAGANSQVDSPTISRFFSNLRQWTSMSSLGMLPFQSLTDVNMAANWLARLHPSKNPFSHFLSHAEAVRKQLDTIFHSQFTDPEKKRIAKQFYNHISSHGGYMGRFADAQNMGDWTSKLSAKFYAANGTVAWDKGNKVGVIAQTETALGQMSKTSYNSLNLDLKKLLNQFNITPAEWDILRTKSERGLFTLDNVDKLTQDDIKAIRAENDDRALYEIKNEVYQKVFSLFDVGAESAILRPGAYERAMMYQGLRPGTLTGEMMRLVMQFKGFPFSYLMRHLVSGFKNADEAQAKVMWGLQNFIYTLPMAYLSTYFYNVMHGKTMPDPSMMSFAEKEAFYGSLLGSSFGSLTNAVGGDTQDGGDLVGSMISNPSIRLLENMLGAAHAASSADPKAAKKNLSKAFLGVMPLNNAPFISPYIRYAMGQKPYLDPGQTNQPWAPGG